MFLSAIKSRHGIHFLPPATFPVFFLEQLTVAFNNCQAIRKVLKLIGQVDYRLYKEQSLTQDGIRRKLRRFNGSR